jgi:hypothetical protein
MSMRDPMRDPVRDPMLDPSDPLDPRPSNVYERRSGMSWGWIIGGLVALLLVFGFIFGRGGDRVATDNTGATTPPATASRPAPAENTGVAPRATPPAAPATPAPATTPSTPDAPAR